MKIDKIATGVVLVLLAIIGGGFKYLPYWDTAELWGRNFFTLILLVGGAYLIYRGYKQRSSKKDNISS